MHDGVAKGWGPGYIGLFHRQINYSVLKKKYLHNNNTMKMFNSTQSDYIRCTYHSCTDLAKNSISQLVISDVHWYTLKFH